MRSPASFYSLFSAGVFNAFPITIKLSNGTWRLYWYQASGGPEIPPNTVKQMSSTDGRTWTVGVDLESSSTVLIGVNGIFETANGDLLRFVEYYTDSISVSGQAAVFSACRESSAVTGSGRSKSWSRYRTTSSGSPAGCVAG